MAIGSMTAGVRAAIATVHRAVYHTDGDVNLVYHSLQNNNSVYFDSETNE